MAKTGLTDSWPGVYMKEGMSARVMSDTEPQFRGEFKQAYLGG